MLGQALAEGIASNPFVRHTDVVVPVPLSTYRQRDRGFNQSEQLAHAVAVELGKTLVIDGLRRTRNTKPQAQLDSPDKRAANVARAFAVDNRAAIAGKRVLLVDDVITTGATVKACAETLRAASVGGVVVAALAHPFRTHDSADQPPWDI
jgi:ComF family protein